MRAIALGPISVGDAMALMSVTRESPKSEILDDYDDVSVETVEWEWDVLTWEYRSPDIIGVTSFGDVGQRYVQGYGHGTLRLLLRYNKACEVLLEDLQRVRPTAFRHRMGDTLLEATLYCTDASMTAQVDGVVCVYVTAHLHAPFVVTQLNQPPPPRRGIALGGF